MDLGHELVCYSRTTLTTSVSSRAGHFRKMNPVDTMLQRFGHKDNSVMPIKSMPF